jgi:hypothetical protein
MVLVRDAFPYFRVMINQYTGTKDLAQPQNRKRDVHFIENAMTNFATHYQNRKSNLLPARMVHL